MIQGSTTGAVEGWLRTIGCTPVEDQDPQAVWHVHIDYPIKTPNMLHVVVPAQNPEAVVIASLLEVAPIHLTAFEALDQDAQADFLFELRRTLNTVDTDFQFEGQSHPQDCPRRIQISAVRYPDGLTLDGFARSLSAVFKAQLNAGMLVQHHLGHQGPDLGGRFDFKRLGI